MNKTNSRKRTLIGYALVLPAFLVVMLTVAYPILSSVIMSFQDGNPVPILQISFRSDTMFFSVFLFSY